MAGDPHQIILEATAPQPLSSATCSVTVKVNRVYLPKYVSELNIGKFRQSWKKKDLYFIRAT